MSRLLNAFIDFTEAHPKPFDWFAVHFAWIMGILFVVTCIALGLKNGWN